MQNYQDREGQLRQAIGDDDHGEGGDLDLGAALNAVNELREAAERRDREHREHLERIEREHRQRLESIEVALNRPGGGGGTDDGETERRAFRDWLRHGGERTPDERSVITPDERRALQVSDDTAGGYLSPPQFIPELLRTVVEFSPVRQAARISQTSAGSIILPKRTARISGSWGGEMEDSQESEPTYGQVEIPVHEMPKVYVDVSNALLEDSAINLENELSFDFGELIGEMEGTAFVSGSGVKMPRGFLTHPDVLAGYFPVGDASDLIPEGIIKAFYSLKASYRARAVWMMNSTTVGVVRTLKDPGDGRFLWREPLSEAAPAALIGRPVVEAPDMPDVASDAFPIAIGDFNRGYRVVDRLNLQILRDPYTMAKKSAVRFWARRRVGGDVTQAEAIRLIKVSTT